MNIIIPGASGFIGKNLLLKLPNDWNVFALYNSSRDFLSFIKKNNLKNVNPVKVNLLEKERVSKIFSGSDSKFDCAVFLAANGNPALSAENPGYDLLNNTITLINFLEAVSVEKFIYFSSGAVYDGLKGNVNPQSITLPNLPYAISKLASENYIRFYQAKKKKINKYIILRFFGAFGPYEPGRKIYSKLVEKFGIQKNTSYTVKGDGNNLIDAMFIEDTIDGILKVIESKHSNITVDFASCNPLTLNELVKKAADTFNVRKPNILNEGIVPEYIEFKVSCDEFNSLFGFKTKIKLGKGLLKLYDFMLKEKSTNA